MPPSRVRVAVEIAPRTGGKAGRVTSAVPPMLMKESLLPPADRTVNELAEKVPPVRERVELTPVEPEAAAPPIARMPTLAAPPVWLKTLVVLLATTSERPICRMELPPLIMLRTAVPLRLKVPPPLAGPGAGLVLTPSMTPRVALAKVVMEPPLML